MPAESDAAEGEVPGEGPPCPLTSPGVVGGVFGTQAVTMKVSTSGVGNPLCTFTLNPPSIGSAGSVVTTVIPRSSATSFAQVQQSTAGARPLSGVADEAFYVNNVSTLQFRKGADRVVVQALFTHARTQQASRIQADLIALAQKIAAQL